MKIKPNNRICKNNKLFAEKEYEVIQISNLRGESPVDLSFKIQNETGEEIWIDDWDCYEYPRVDRFAYLAGRLEADQKFL